MMLPNTLLGFLMLLNPDVHSDGVVPGVPRIRCEIQMTRWCIAIFDGDISMRGGANGRIWTLMGRSGMDRGPLEILEDKACFGETAPERTIPKLIEQRVEGNVQSETYSLGTQGCRLEFHWPNKSNSTYRRLVDFGILIDPLSAHPKQLYSSRQ